MSAARHSAGILLARLTGTGFEVLIGHLGGPYWSSKDAGAWTIPKGELEADEDPLAAAEREFAEELGRPVPDGPRLDLGTVRQRGGKTVSAFAVVADFDESRFAPGTFDLEWPPRSGRIQQFPELDRIEWTDRSTAETRLVSAQRELLGRLSGALAQSP